MLGGKEFSEELSKLGWYLEGNKKISWKHPKYPHHFILRGYYEVGGVLCCTERESDESGFNSDDIDIYSIDDVKQFMYENHN